jgi:hypothetical protein
MTVNVHHVGLLIATLGSAAVGLERQWSGHADGPAARFGGIRTSMARGMSGAAPLELAARVIGIGVATNTALKLPLALVLRGIVSRHRRRHAGSNALCRRRVACGLMPQRKYSPTCGIVGTPLS